MLHLDGKASAARILIALIALVAGFIRPLHAQESSNGSESIEALLATADVTAGQKLSNKCSACHTFDKGGHNRFGPNLWGIVGAPHAHKADYNYSDALKALHGQKWTDEALNLYLLNPKSYAPGTKMTFPGIKDAQARANLIAWLHTLSDNPVPLPKGK